MSDPSPDSRADRLSESLPSAVGVGEMTLKRCASEAAMPTRLRGLRCKLSVGHGGPHQSHDDGGRRVTWYEALPVANVFDEDRLRAEIVSVWGEHGAHVEVFDAMRSRPLLTDAAAGTDDDQLIDDFYDAVRDRARYIDVEPVSSGIRNAETRAEVTRTRAALLARLRAPREDDGRASRSGESEGAPWTQQDRDHLAHLANADDPQWMGEVAGRAAKYIASLESQLAALTVPSPAGEPSASPPAADEGGTGTTPKQTVEEFAGRVAEAMALDAEAIEDAENWPNENLLPLVHGMRTDAARWRWLMPRLGAHPGAGGTTHVEAWLPAPFRFQDHLGPGRTALHVVDSCMAKDAEFDAAALGNPGSVSAETRPSRWDITRAKSALENWGRHHPWCNYLNAPPASCNCGLAQEIAALASPRESPGSVSEPTDTELLDHLEDRLIESTGKKFLIGPDDRGGLFYVDPFHGGSDVRAMLRADLVLRDVSKPERSASSAERTSAKPPTCIHCGEIQATHGRFARCQGGQTQFTPAPDSAERTGDQP